MQHFMAFNIQEELANIRFEARWPNVREESFKHCGHDALFIFFVPLKTQ